MEKRLNCIHNTAIFPDMGVICDLRKPNSLCKNCKFFKSKNKKESFLKRFINFLKKIFNI